MGKSDVTLMWDQQVAADNLATIALQRVFEHRSYWELPAAGMNDHRGSRFTFRDDQRNVMYRDASAMGPLDVRVHSAPGLDWQGFNAAYGVIQQKLVAYRGTTDFGLTPENSKNFAVGTIERLTQQGNIPVEEYKRRKNQELSKFYGVLSDYIHATYTAQRLTRLNIEGTDLLVQLWGHDLPNFDFVVEESPEFTGLDKQRSEAFNAAMQVIPMAVQLGIPVGDLLEVFADLNNIPRSVIRKLEKALEAGKAAGGIQPGGNQGTEGGPPDPLQALMQGLNGGGNVPQPVA
jgi:hypothetical protein